MSESSIQPTTPARRRLRRWILALLAAVLAASGWGLYRVTRPDALAALILPRASEALGGEVVARRISLTGLNELTIEGLAVRAPGWPGISGELANAERLEVRFALLPLFVGEVRVRTVRSPKLLLRLTEKESSGGEFNVMSLGCWSRPASGSAGGFVRPEMISIEELRIENGVLAHGRYRALGDIGLRGELTPSEASDTAMKLSLAGRGNSTGALLVREIRGEIDPARRSARVAVEDLRVAEDELPVAPVLVRNWLRQVGFTGAIARATFSYAPDAPPSATIDVADLALNLELGQIGGEALERGWSGFADGRRVEIDAVPRMKLARGSLRISTEGIALENVAGELGAEDPQGRVRPVPFQGRFAMRLPKSGLEGFEWEKRDEWVEAIARTAPFEGEIVISEFESDDSESPRALFLPSAVTGVLSDFGITRWKIQLHAGFSRGEPAASGEPAPLRSTGGLTLSGGIGSFVEFPYLLEDVEGVFEYEDDDLRVVSVNGKGSEGAEVSITGELNGLSTGAEIDLLIRCDRTPIDDRLLDSFSDAPRRALSLLFDRRMMKSMSDARLLPTGSAFRELRSQLATLASRPGRDDEKARLERALAAGDFRTGAEETNRAPDDYSRAGTCALEIRVYSPPGFGVPVEVSGTVSEIDAGVLFSRFPYPLRLRGGKVVITDESIDLGESGLVAITPAGGVLTVGGAIELPRLGDGERGLITNITIRDEGDAVNPALLAAIPFAGGEAPDGWPGTRLSEAAEFLTRLGLRGDVGFVGTVKTRADGSDDFDIELDFSRGVAQPDDASRALLAQDGLPWPADFALVECGAKVHISPTEIELREFSGRHGSGAVRGSGRIDVEGPNRRIDLEFEDLPVGRAFEGFLASDPAEASRRFKEYAPEGSIRGSIARIVDASGARTTGSLTPDHIEITLGGGRVRAERVDGVLGVSEGGLRAEGLRFELASAGESDGTLELSGPLDGARTDATPLALSIDSCRVESPIVRHLLAERARGVLDLLRARSAEGRFDASHLAGASERTTIRPRTLVLGEPDARVGLEFDRSSEIVLEGARATFRAGAALSPDAGGGRVAFEGTFDGAATAGDMNRFAAKLSLASGALTPALRKQLPPPFDLALEYTDLTSKGAFTLELPSVELRWPGDGSAAQPDEYRLDDARMGFDAGDFSAGTKILGAGGALDVRRFTYAPRRSNAVALESTLALTGGRVFDRPIGASTARIASADGGDAISIDGAGDVAFGRFDLQARVDLRNKAYALRARVADADFEVLRTGAPLTAETARSPSRLTGTVSVSGPVSGDPAERRGSGRLFIRNANLASLPVAMRALQLTQLMLPLSSTVSASEASFDIEGGTALVRRCKLAAGTIDLEGSGTVDIATFGLGLRLFAKGTLPIVSDVIGGVTSQIFAIDISGSLAEPKASLAPLPGMSDAPVPQAPAAATGEPAPPAAVPAGAEPKKP